jgi:REP element-mobilizing transposase RayT
MNFNQQKLHRRSIRLKGFDYTQPGAYFITIITSQREEIYGEISNGEMRLNQLGEIVRTEWLKTVNIRSNVELHEDEFVIMPNHLHGIIWIVDEQVGATPAERPLGGAGSPLSKDRTPWKLGPLEQLWHNSNPSPPNESTPCAVPGEYRFGKEIISSISFEMKSNLEKFAITFKIIP